MQGVWKNDDFRSISRSIWETVIVRWAYSARQFLSIEFSFHPYNILVWLPQGRLQGKQKCGLRYVKTAIFGTCGSNNWETVEDRWVGLHAARVWQALNCLFIHATFCVIAAAAFPGQTKNEGRGTQKWRFFCNCGSNNWETVVDRQLTH